MLIVIDSLRADKFYGNSKTAVTPNIDLLIKKGVYFTQAVSSADVTGKCLGNIFTGMYSYKTGINNHKFNSEIRTIFDIVKEHGSSLYAAIPNLTWYKQLENKFDKVDRIDVLNADKNGLVGDIGDQIIERLQSNKTKQPWFYYIHLVDLRHKGRVFSHNEIIVPPEFDKRKFGETKYERMLSYVDVWLGKILNNIDLKNTVVIITADHADVIPIESYSNKISQLEKLLRKIGNNKTWEAKKYFPMLTPIGKKLFILIERIITNLKRVRLEKKFTIEQMRTLNARGDKTLYDEKLRVPLLIIKKGINPNIVNKLVGNIDIFSTIIDIFGIKNDDAEIDSKSLLSIIEGKETRERPMFIESGDNMENEGFVIGIRTSKFKYYRSRTVPDKDVHLYDLQKDPLEKYNIATSIPEIVESMERILKSFQIKSTVIETEKDDNDKKIEKELKKLGYI